MALPMYAQVQKEIKVTKDLKAKAVAKDPRLARPRTGTTCTYYPNGSGTPMKWAGSIDADGYCQPVTDAIASVVNNIGKPCTLTESSRDTGRVTQYAGTYDDVGGCIKNSTLSVPVFEDPDAQAPAPAEKQSFLTAGMGGVPHWVLALGAVGAAVYLLRKKRR